MRQPPISSVDRSRGYARRLTLVAAITLILTACGGGGGDGDETSESKSRSRTAGRTAWERVLEGIGDDGTVSKETALAAFSLAVADLPGVDVPKGDPGPIPDGSSAVAWVLRYYDELTPAQQRAVGEALGSGIEPSSAGSGRGSGSKSGGSTTKTQALRWDGTNTRVEFAAQRTQAALGCYGQPLATADSPNSEKYRALVDKMIDEVGSHLNITMNLKTYVVVEKSAKAGDKSDAYSWVDRSDCTKNVAETCTIHFNPRAATDSAVELRSVVAHEVTHCYVFSYLGVRAYDLPPWLGEGFPAWAGETIANGSPVSDRWWRTYLTGPGKATFGRVYDAIGFFAHMDETGADPWQRAVPMLSAFSNEPAWEAGVGSGNGAFLDSWPSGFAREPSRGSAWDTRMAGITADKAGLQTRRIGNGQSLTQGSPPGGNTIVGLAISGDVLVIESSSYGRMAGENDEVVLRDAGPLCLRQGGCECPPESEGAGQDTTRFLNPELLAVTGGLEQGAAKLEVISLEDWCGPERAKVDRCLVGRWVSTRVVIIDEVTGAPSTELGGGDGAVMTIARNGDVVIDHNSMNPMRSNVAGIAIQTVVRGVSHATIEAMNGQMKVVTNDFANTATAQVQTGPLAGRPLAGTPILGTGTYQCSASSLQLSSPYPLGTAESSFDKR